MVRCKFTCLSKEEFKNQDTGEVTGARIQMRPAYTGSEENKMFFKYTPSGEIRFETVNPDAASQIEQGKDYYIDITEA